MALTLETAPAMEPIAIADMRGYLRLDGIAEDNLIASLITAARLHVEARIGRVFITQKWRWDVESCPPSRLEIPLMPVSIIDSVKLVAPDDSESLFAAERYAARILAGKARINLVGAPPASGEALRIRFTAGYGDSADKTPDTIREAIRQLVAHWFETRGVSAEAPPSVEALLASYKSVRL